MCVIGGGPSGAALSLRLAQLGLSVVVVEKQCFPRPHVGESLVGDVLPLLEVLGLRTAIENAGFPRPSAAFVKWAGSTERRESAGPPGFQVDRGKFDEILLQGARNAGATVLQPARVSGLDRNGQGGWNIILQDAVLQDAARSWTLQARFLAAATGRAGLPGLPATRRRVSPATLALYAYWQSPNLHGTHFHGDHFHATHFHESRFHENQGTETRIEAGGNEWFWGAPLPQGEFVAAVFIDPSRYSSGVARAGGLQAFYRELLASSTLLADCLHGSSCGPARCCDATSLQDEIPAAPDSIKVGEASFAIDPLSSQGVQTALGSALHAAAVVRTILQRPDNTDQALEFYRARQSESVVLHARAAEKFYAEAARARAGEFWQKRTAHDLSAGDEAPSQNRKSYDGHAAVQLSPEVRIETTPVLQDDFIVPAQALMVPGLPRPVVFLGGMEVVPLVATIKAMQAPVTIEGLLRRWSQRMPEERARAVFHWLWTAGVLGRA